MTTKSTSKLSSIYEKKKRPAKQQANYGTLGGTIQLGFHKSTKMSFRSIFTMNVDVFVCTYLSPRLPFQIT